jgi:hypothetical protein
VNKLAAVLALVVTTLPTLAQTKLLGAKSRVHVTATGRYQGIAFPTTCDEQGRLYVKFDMVGLGMAGSPLLRLSRNGAVEAKFDTSKALINRYAVRPDGGVVTVRSERAGKFIDNFSSDGKFESSVLIEHPTIPFFPSQLAVFPSGEILVSGLQYEAGYRASTAIFDRTGRLLKQFALDGDEEIERAVAGDTRAQQRYSSAIDQSAAIRGDDGLVYLMRATSPVTVYAISADGEVVRKIVVDAPGGKGLPDFGIRVAKNRLAVQFRQACDTNVHPCRTDRYAVLDATTGKRLADYETDKEAVGTMACFAPDPDRFLIFSQNPLGFEIVEAAPE